MSKKSTITRKIVVIGQPGVGKTSFVTRYVHNVFNNVRKSTIGVDFASAVFHWNDELDVVLQFWDLAGQEGFNEQSSVYYRNAHAAIVVYDVNDDDSKLMVSAWRDLLRQRVVFEGAPVQIPCILIGNKIDLQCPNNSDEFDTTDLDNLGRACEFDAWFPTSSLGNYNIAQAVKTLVQLLVQRFESGDFLQVEKTEPDDKNTLVIVDSEGQPLPSKSWCCSGSSGSKKNTIVV